MSGTITCYGACGGDPAYRQPGGVLPCILCGGQGVLPAAKSPEAVVAAYAVVAARGRLSRSAIIAGDVDAGPARTAPHKRYAQRRPRLRKAQRIALAREERRRREEAERVAFESRRPTEEQRKAMAADIAAIRKGSR